MAVHNYKRGTVATTLTVPVDEAWTNHEIGITFYSDATYETVVTGTGMTGTVGMTMTPAVNDYEQDIAGATALDVSVEADYQSIVMVNNGVSSITATPTSITGATHWRLEVRSYE